MTERSKGEATVAKPRGRGLGSKVSELARRGFRLAALLVLLVGAVAATALVLPLDEYVAPEVRSVDGRTASVTERETDLLAPVEVALEWSAPRALTLSPMTTGTVTEVHLRPGRPLDCGDTLLRVDGYQLIAYCAERPLWRAIDQTTVGTDVDEFMAFTTELGFPPFANPAAPTRTERRERLRQFEGIFGLPVQGIISPGNLYWLREPVAMSTITVVPGDVLVGGETIARDDPALVAASVVDWSRPGDEAGARVFNVDQSPERFVIGVDGTVAIGAVLEPELARLGLLAEGLPALIRGSTRLSEPIVATAVPVSSLISAGGPCVFVLVGEAGGEEGESGDQIFEPRPVQIISSELGGVMVIGDLVPGDRVDLAPPGSC